MHMYINTLDNRQFVSKKTDDDDIEEQEEDSNQFIQQRPDVQPKKPTGIKKHFGAPKEDGEKGGEKWQKDFVASNELKPEMKANGFIVDKYLSKVARMI
jgi:hypothetical protein